MKRRYNREFFQDKIQQIKKQMPDAFIGVDVIVGFPGEDEEKLRETFEFLQNLNASYYHVFPFTRRPNTSAARMEGQVSAEEVKQRSKKLQELAEKKIMAFYKQHLGEKREVLFENHNQHGKIFGYTDNYIRIEKNYNPEWAGKIKKAALKQINDQGNVAGEICDE